MDFGQVAASALKDIDFRLPHDDSRGWKGAAAASNFRRNPTFRMGIGAPVWAVKGWIGKVYPLGTEPKDFLFHYSRQFNSIELNSTHYRTPDDETIRRWRESTPPGFKFNVKFVQEVSHRRPLVSQKTRAIEFCAQALKLEDRLGLSFLQLPPTFAIDDIGDLRAFLALLPEGFQLAVEFRHSSCFDNHRLKEKIFDVLAETKTHAVITDVAGRRDVLHTSLPTPRVLVRFIGNDVAELDDARLAAWSERWKTWIENGIENIEVAVHEPDDLSAPERISFLTDRMNELCDLKMDKWKPALAGRQLGFFD